jgi:hypothetical protein
MAGDIVVTKVVDRYHIGRVAANGKAITVIDVRDDRAEALAFACTQVTGDQRVILYYRSGSLDRREVPCRDRRS